MSGRRQRQASPHSVEVLLQVNTSGSGMGNKRTWSRTGVFLPCAIHPMSSKDDTELLQTEPRTLFRVYFSPDPSLNGEKHRLSVVKPNNLAGYVLRVHGVSLDKYGKGEFFVAVCEYVFADQQTSPALLPSALPGKGRRRKKAGG